MDSKLNINLPYYNTSSLDFYLPFGDGTNLLDPLSGNHPFDDESDTLGVVLPSAVYGFPSAMCLPPTKWKCPFKGVGLLCKDRVIFLHHRVIKDRKMIDSLSVEDIARYDNTYFLRCVMEYTESKHDGVVSTMLLMPFRVIPFNPSEGFLYPVKTYRYEEHSVHDVVDGVTITKVVKERIEELRETLPYLRLWYTLFDCSRFVLSDDILDKWQEFADIHIFPVPSTFSDMTLPRLMQDTVYPYTLDMPLPYDEFQSIVSSHNSMLTAYYQESKKRK